MDHISIHIKPGDDISSTVNMLKGFLSKVGEKYALQKKSNAPSDIPKLQEIDSQLDRAEPSYETTNTPVLQFNSTQLRLTSYRRCIYHQ